MIALVTDSLCFLLLVSSITLVGEGDRSMLKTAIKRSESDKVRHRIVPDESVKAMFSKLENMKDEVSEVLKEEQEEKAVRWAYFCLTSITI